MLRDYQQKLVNDIFASWFCGFVNVLAVAPTGAGKTVVKAAVAQRFGKPSIAIAHRQELVSQISLAFARAGIYHNIIAPPNVIKFCVSRHMIEVGKSFHYVGSPVTVAGVDTLNRRIEELMRWIIHVRLWQGDEGHHWLADNKWGKSVSHFHKDCVGLGVTATPKRTDGKPLSSVYNKLVLGPTPRYLMDHGYLSDYRVWSLPPSYHMNDSEDISKATGDYKPDALRKRAHGSKVVGDIVDTYIKHAAGELGITFVVSVEQAEDTANAFRQKGVPALALSGNSTDDVRQSGIDKFKRGEIKQLVNVDLFDEGFDVPGASAVSIGRRTLSLIKHKQQIGRVLRPEENKQFAKIFDHVGNCMNLRCLPDTEFPWSLDGTSNEKKSATLKLKTCTNCFLTYEAFHAACPYCGYKEVPAERSMPEHVDGDLVEFSEELLKQLRGDIKRLDGPVKYPPGLPDYAQRGAQNRWEDRQEAQRELRDVIAQWAGIRKYVHDRTDSQSYREFYHTYGVDVLTAQTLGAPDARRLAATIREEWV